MNFKNFKLIAPEPHEPSETFETVVRSRSLAEAKKYLRWLHNLYNNGKPLKIEGWPTNEDEIYTTEYWKGPY